MPLYEYSCSHCGSRFERRLKFDDRHTPQACPDCGRLDAELRLSSPAPLAAAAPVRTCASTGQPCNCSMN